MNSSKLEKTNYYVHQTFIYTSFRQISMFLFIFKFDYTVVIRYNEQTCNCIIQVRSIGYYRPFS